MAPTGIERLQHIKSAIATIRDGLHGTAMDVFVAHPILLSGFRYELLVIGEASRALPNEWKARFGPTIPWRQLEDLGNRLRHAYHDINTAILWSIYVDDLDPLEAAIDAMIAAYSP